MTNATKGPVTTAAPSISGAAVVAAAADASDEALARRARARRASIAFNRDFQGTLTGFARSLTGNSTLRVIAGPQSCTDGKTIWIRPPIELGDLAASRHAGHGVCDRRDENDVQRCNACRIREDVIITLYHEVAHMAYDSFETLDDVGRQAVIQKAVKHSASRSGGSTTRAAKLEKLLNDNPPANYLEAARAYSPFLPVIVNALEDVRVNLKTYLARPGTFPMFRGQAYDVFINGIDFNDGQGRQTWSDAPDNAQAVVGLFAKAAGYAYENFFKPEIVAALNDKELTVLLDRLSTVRSIAGVYDLAVPALEALRRLGYCLTPEDVEDDPEPEADEPEADEPDDEDTDGDDDESGDDDEDADDAGRGEPCEDGEPGAGGDEESDDNGGDGGESDDDGEPSDEAGDGTDGDAPSDDDGDDDGEAGEGDSDAEGDDEGAGSPSDEDGDDGEAGDEAGNGTDGDEGDEPGESNGGGEGDFDGDDASDQEGDDAGDGTPGSDSSSTSESDGDGEEVGQGPDLPDKNDSDGGSSPSIPSAEDDDEEFDGADDGGEGFGDDDEADDAGDGDGEGYGDDDADGDDGDGQTREGTDVAAEEHDDGDHGETNDHATPTFTAGGGDAITRSAPVDDSDEVKRWLDEMGDHSPVESTPEEEADAREVARAVVQDEYFDEASVGIVSVRIHRMENPVIVQQPHGETNLTEEMFFGSDNDRHTASAAAQLETFVPEQSAIGRSLLEMRLAFEANRRSKNERNLKAGKINGRVLGRRAAVGDVRLFHKKSIPAKRDYFVVIGLDISGSTSGARLQQIKKSAMALAELLHRTGVSFEIWAHTGNYHFDADGSFTYRTPFDLDMGVIKEANEPWDVKTQTRLARLRSSGCNIDGHTLEFYRKRCDASLATDKVIMYFTDGAMPAANYDEELVVLEREIAECRRRGYTLLGVGIANDEPTQYGLDTVRVDSMDDIPKVVTHLGKRLARRVALVALGVV